jgi:hypothetical protein
MKKLALTLPDGQTIEGPKTTAGQTLEEKFPDIGSIITALLPYIFVLAGLTLFILLIIGGFGMLTSGGSPEKMKAAQGKITSAVIGFVIIFISYWLMRILEIIFGISILS